MLEKKEMQDHEPISVLAVASESFHLVATNEIKITLRRFERLMRLLKQLMDLEVSKDHWNSFDRIRMHNLWNKRNKSDIMIAFVAQCPAHFDDSVHAQKISHLFEQIFLEKILKTLDSEGSFMARIMISPCKAFLDDSNKLSPNKKCWKEFPQQKQRFFKKATSKKENNYEDKNQAKQKLFSKDKEKIKEIELFLKIKKSICDSHGKTEKQLSDLLGTLDLPGSSGNQPRDDFRKDENIREQILGSTLTNCFSSILEKVWQLSIDSPRHSSVVCLKSMFSVQMGRLVNVLQTVAFPLFEETTIPFEVLQQNFFRLIKQVCIESSYNNKEESMLQTIERNAFEAFSIVTFFSLAQFTASLQKWSKCIKSIGREVIYISSRLLNPENSFIKSFCEISDVFLEAKLKIMKQFIKESFEESLTAAHDRDQRWTYFWYACADGLGWFELCRSIENLSGLSSFSATSQTTDIETKNDITTDGRIYSRVKDPPGQRSVYIPPGNPTKEAYRLSTYIKFPQSSPVNPRNLAAAGFFYTGYKDRVKCFCCACCVEQWMSGDDVGDARWHSEDCKMMLGQESGNISISFRQFTRMRNQSGGNTSRTTMTTSPSHSPGYSTGQLCTSALSQFHSSQSESYALQQTARAAGTPRQPNQCNSALEIATILSPTHQQLVCGLDLWKEAERLLSFETWPGENQVVHPRDLARSGFFYLGNLDRVQCFSCQGVLRNWSSGDSVDNAHRSHFPDCRMVRGIENRNVTLASNAVTAPATRSAAVLEPPDPSAEEQRGLLEIFPCSDPVSLHMSSEEERFKTFDSHWDKSRVFATPRQIAKAGFFFLGERDRVKCWYCNGGLQNWSRDDEPWTEHAKWFPMCEFVLQKKGPGFVHHIVASFPNLPRPTIRGPADASSVRHSDNQQHNISLPVSTLDQSVNTLHALNVMSTEQTGIDEIPIENIFERSLEIGDSSILTNEGRSISSLHAVNHEGDISGASSLQATNVKVPVPKQPEAASSSSNNPHMERDTSLPEGMSPSMILRVQELHEEQNCKICFANIVKVMFLPCGHCCSCANCAQVVKNCPICQRKINKVVLLR